MTARRPNLCGMGCVEEGSECTYWSLCGRWRGLWWGERYRAPGVPEYPHAGERLGKGETPLAEAEKSRLGRLTRFRPFRPHPPSRRRSPFGGPGAPSFFRFPLSIDLSAR
jgi:hypothetical protein